jgi:hypothetical protein
MKNILALSALALGLVCTTANAASIKTTPQPSQGNNYAVFVDAEGTVFDSVQVDIVAQGGFTFTQIISGTGGDTNFRGPNVPGTFRNRAIDGDPLDGGKGWLVPSGGVVINATTLSYGMTAGAPINTAAEPDGRLFLANVNLSGPATYPTRAAQVTLTLVNAGATVQTLTGFLPAPEPASFGLAGIASIAGFAFRRRRSA